MSTEANDLRAYIYYVSDVMCLTSVSHLGFLNYTFNLKVSLSTQFTIIIALVPTVPEVKL